MGIISKIELSDRLLSRFNLRDDDAFTDVYTVYFEPLMNYAEKIYINTEVSAEDVIQDIFISILDNRKISFMSFPHLRNYLYLSVRNSFKNYIVKKSHKSRFTDMLLSDEDYLNAQIIESESLSIICSAIELLPEECAKVFKMHLEGWEVKEIAEKLSKSQSTVYNQRNDAVNLLKRKFSGKILSVYLSLMF